METVTNEIANNGDIYAGLASLIGTLVAFGLMASLNKIKTYVRKTENKIDDAILDSITAAVENAFKKNKTKKKAKK